MEPPDSEVLDTFWRYIDEREVIRLRREAGAPPPWTDDQILRDNRFCNVFRRDDRGSRYLIDTILSWEDPAYPEQHGLILYNVFLYRAFNKPETFAGLLDDGCFVVHDTEVLIDRLSELAKEGSLYNNAYLLRGVTGEFPKYASFARILGQVWDQRDAIADEIKAGRSIRNALGVLLERRIPLWGEFTCYQVVLDLTYCSILADPVDLNTWCVFGSGAKEGLRQLWPNIKLREPEMLEAATYLLDQSKKSILSHVPPLSLQDIEFNLCELSKYLRLQKGGRRRRPYHPSTQAAGLTSTRN